MNDILHSYTQSTQLEADLYAWIEDRNQPLIDQALLLPPMQHVDIEEVLRFTVHQHNIAAFDALISYCANTRPASFYSTCLQSVVWDSVVHNVEPIWNRYFNWNPIYTPQHKWRDLLYAHTAKHNNLNMMAQLQSSTSISLNSWREALSNCVDKGYADIFDYLLKHPVGVDSQHAALSMVAMIYYSENHAPLFDVVFEYVPLHDILDATPSKKAQIMDLYAVYEQKKAQEQRQTLMDNITPPSLLTKRKL